jgi:hypothetical protein
MKKPESPVIQPGVTPQRQRNALSFNYEKNKRDVQKADENMVAKKAFLNLSGSFDPAFSGTLAISSKEFIDHVIESITIKADSRIVVSETPSFFINMARLMNGSRSPLRSKANSTSLDGSEAVDNLAFGTTGQSVAIDQVIMIDFENYLTNLPWNTFLDTSAFSNVTVEIKWGDLASAFSAATSSSVTSSDLTADIWFSTSDDDMGGKFDILRRSFEEFQFSSSGKKILDIKRDGKLAGIYFELLKDSDKRAVTWKETTEVEIGLKVNTSSEQRQAMKLSQFALENETKYQLDQTPVGWGFMSILNNRQYQSTIDMDRLNKLELQVDLASALDFATHTNYYLRTHFLEVIPGRS